ncbi:MinD/ParA family ATP-binding protein [Nocardia cyriacigeorgica]|uniref:Flp pilus assembly protein, ATPase CpaE n=1 Tax=Nocardia cyriacigeorgica TaxID=135487 RepID=A0A4V6ID26_9NOCA|nr:AAA family ATPase [Nocardia cyriacigeorgica]VFB01864.1 Flp pilus assembly protein, ATPase CpaE [Nocardia cyriacigeorgica]
MNRAPTTNGHSAEPVRARGGYDAYFAQQVDLPPGSVTGAGAAGVNQPSSETPDASRIAGDPRVAAPPPGSSAAPQQVSVPGAPSSLSLPISDAPPPAANPMAAGEQTAAGQARPAQEQQQQQQQQQQQMGSQPGYQPAQPGQLQHPATGTATPPTNNWVPDRVEVTNVDQSRVEVLPVALTSIELLANISAANQAQLRSNSGVRGALNKVGFRLGLSPAEQRTEDRRSRIRRQLNNTYQIAMISVKGGVGRTTTTATLGSTFASLRPDRVVAIDANPDFGDLSTRTVRHPYGLTLRELARDPNLGAFSAVQSYTSVNASNLAVLASPWTTEANEALSGQEYGTGVEILRRHYNLLLVDCGTGVLDSATRTVLQTSDAVVVVTPATVGGVTGAVATLNWLSTHGLDRLIAKSMVAIVHHQPLKPTVDVEAIENLFATAHRPTFTLPYDAHLAEGGEIDLRLVTKETKLAFEELAAALADDFPTHLAGDPGHHGGWR